VVKIDVSNRRTKHNGKSQCTPHRVPEFDTREDHASNQTRSQVLRFVWQKTFLGGKIFVFFCLRQILPGTTKFGKAQQI